MKLIDSITIRYFRSVYTLALDNCKDITVISGKNDVGKSNILKALNLFFNGQTDYLHLYNFEDDYSIDRKEEVRKDTIKGQQFISITVRFLRGNMMQNSLPPSFSVTRRWDKHSSEYKTTSDVQPRMRQYALKEGIKYSERITATFLSTFLNRIKFLYIPAIKDERVFNYSLDVLQQSLFDSKNRQILDAPIGQANEAIQGIIKELQNDFQKATGIQNFVELPNTLNYTNGLLQINTQVKTKSSTGSVTIDKRGDGIRTHYIPKILNYVAMNSKNLYIWGFEEPENSYEYRRCIQVAEEFENQYCKNSQIFITSHSPAFFKEKPGKKIIILEKNNGRTDLLKNDKAIEEELGYIELYREFIEQVKALEAENKKKEEEITELKEAVKNSTGPILLTEGKTDSMLLKLAIKKLNIQDYGNWDIRPIKCKGSSAGNTALLDYLIELQNNMQLSTLVIGMFDRDVAIEIIQNDNKVDIRDKEFVKLGERLYAFAIPVPHERVESDQISIEHYFTDREIKTEINGKRLFMGNEFHETGVYKGDEELFYKAGKKVANTIKIVEHETNCYVTKVDATGDYSISKARFVQAIEEDAEGFKEFSFDEFKKIFDVLSSIMTDLTQHEEKVIP